MAHPRHLNRIITVSVTATEYTELLETAERAGFASVAEYTRELLTRSVLASALTHDPVANLVIQGYDDGAISRQLGWTRAAVASRRRYFGLAPNKIVSVTPITNAAEKAS